MFFSLIFQITWNYIELRRVQSTKVSGKKIKKNIWNFLCKYIMKLFIFYINIVPLFVFFSPQFFIDLSKTIMLYNPNESSSSTKFRNEHFKSWAFGVCQHSKSQECSQYWPERHQTSPYAQLFPKVTASHLGQSNV